MLWVDEQRSKQVKTLQTVFSTGFILEEKEERAKAETSQRSSASALFTSKDTQVYLREQRGETKDPEKWSHRMKPEKWVVC